MLRPATKLRALAVAWGAALIVGAAWLQRYRPRDRVVARVLASEITHVTAHTLLYGTLAVIVWLASAGRRRVVILACAIVALLQEGAQSVLYGRAPGRPELFDWFVDAVSVSVALLLCGWWARPRTIETNS